MRVKAAVLAALMIASLVVRSGAATAARPKSRALLLGKTNVITGSTTGYARVVVSRQAVLDFGALTYIKGDLPRLFTKSGPSPSVTVSGEGDFIGSR